MELLWKKLEIKEWSREFRKVKNQFLSVMLANFIVFSLGCGFGWLSPAIFILQSKDSPLPNGPLSVDQISWLGGLSFAGSLIGNLIFAFVSQFVGLKQTIWLTALPSVVSWSLIVFTRNIVFLYVSRFLIGILGGGVYFCIPLFVSQISDEKIRGTLGSLLCVNFYSGILLSYIIGLYLPYDVTPLFMITFQIIFFLLFVFVPDTPHYLLSKGRNEKAEKSLRFYKNCYGLGVEDCDRFNVEMEKVVISVGQETKEKLSFSDFCTPEARKGFLICSILVLLFTLNGNSIFAIFAINVFQASGSSMDPKISSIILGTIQLIATFPTLFLVDRLGRRPLLITTTFGCFIALSAMGTFTFYAHHGYDVSTFSWVPVTALSISVCCSCCGIIPVVVILIPEVFPTKIRSIGCLITIMMNNAVLFAVSTAFPLLVQLIDLYSCLWVFAFTCIIGLVFSIFFLKDTTGQNLNHI